MAGTLVANTINTDTGLFSTNNAYNGIAKAWVLFTYQTSASPSIAIANSFNVSSITRNSTGDYTVNFTTAMPNTSYAIQATCNNNNNGQPNNMTVKWGTGTAFANYSASLRTTTQIELINGIGNTSTPNDIGECSVSIFA